MINSSVGYIGITTLYILSTTLVHLWSKYYLFLSTETII